MDSIFHRLKELDSNPNWQLIDDYNRQFGTKQPKYRLIVNEQIRPCFFSGDVESTGKVVTISLNPAYKPGVTEVEQGEMDFEEWYRFCQNRFMEYERDEDVHLLFKNLFKLIAPPLSWKSIDKREYLQSNLLNLDWCYYYSENFPSFDITKLPQSLQQQIAESLDRTLSWLINQVSPRYIFVHGRAMQSWVEQHSEDLEAGIQVRSSNGPCQLFQGRYVNSSVRIYYLEHFINRANANTTLEQLNEYVNSEYQC